MGIYNRDYFRDSTAGGSSPGFGGGGTGNVCKQLIIATVVVFLLQLIVTRAPDGGQPYPAQYRISVVQEWFSLDPESTVYGGQVWRLVTYAFLHDRSNIWHIVFNMLFLWWFGSTLERMYGSREFLIFYLVAAALAGIAFVGFGMVMGDLTPAIGASGSVMAVLMLYATHFPRDRIYLFFGLLPIEIRWLVAFYVVVDLHPILLALGGTDFNDGIAHSAHLGGLLFGYLYRRNNWRLETGWNRMTGWGKSRLGRRGRSRPEQIRIYHPDDQPEPQRQPQDEDFKERVDAILTKIYEQGEASLTDREREILKQASQKFKRR